MSISAVVNARLMLKMAGAASTEVLIVGVAHLDGTVPTKALQRALQILLGWAPDMVAVERIPGYLVEQYEQRGGAFADFPVSGAPLARRAASAAKASRPWDVWEARRIATDPSQPLDDRVLGWLLAREPCNALLLPWHEADLPPVAADALTELAASSSEVVRVGVALARALGHSEVAHIDDHTGVSLLEHLPADWSNTVQDFQTQVRSHLDPPTAGSESSADVWVTWEQAATSAFRNWGEELESSSMANLRGDDVQTAVLRARHSQWRSRNLAMAARLREAMTTIPGGRLVVLVGSSHERPLRAALSVDQHDLDLIDITKVRRQFEAQQSAGDR